MSLANDDYYQQRLNRMRADVREFVKQIQSTLESLTRRMGIEGAEEFVQSQAGKGTTPLSSAKVPTDHIADGAQTMMYDDYADQEHTFASASHTVHGSEARAAMGTQTMMYDDEYKTPNSYSSSEPPSQKPVNASQTVLYDNDFSTDRLSRLKDMIANKLSSEND